jgi:hypothetical protein
MRALGMVLLTGVGAVVAWKILAALFLGLFGMLMKVGLLVLVVWIVLQMVNGKKRREEAA